MRPGTFTAVLTMLWLRHGPDEALAVQPGFLDFDNLPDTNFSCENKVIGGYYADVETGCQMFHVCTIGQKGEITDIKFLCLNGTVFDQETRVCERVDEVDCNKTLSFYDLNLELYGNSPQLSYSEEDTTEGNYHDDLGREATSSPLTTTTPATTTTTTVTSTTPPTTTSSSTTRKPFFFTTPAREQFLPTVNSYEDEDHPYGIHGLHSFKPPRVDIDKPGQSGFLSGSSAGLRDEEHPHHQHFVNNRFTSTTHAPTHLFNVQNHGPSGFSITSTSRPQSFHANPFAERDSSQEYRRPFPSVSPGFINHQLSQPSPSSLTTTKRPPFSIIHNSNRQNPIVHAAQNLRTKVSSGEDGFAGHQGVHLHSQNPLAFNFNSHQQGHQLLTTPSVAVVATTISTSKSMNSKGLFFKPQAGVPSNSSDYFRLSPVVSVNLTVSSPHFPQTSVPPSTYDEYLEHDVHSDPFFKDVPRVGRTRSKTAAQRGLERHKRGLRPVISSDDTLLKSPDHDGNFLSRVVSKNSNDKVYGGIFSRKGHARKKISAILSSEDLEGIAKISEETRSRVYNYPVLSVTAYSDENKLQSVARRRRTAASSSEQTAKGRVSRAPLESRGRVGAARGAVPRRSARQAGYYDGGSVPATSFTCKDKVPGGYYADLETDCQLFHICSQGRHGRLTDNKFWCGPGTRFNQLSRTCQSSELVDCALASSLYHLNNHFLPEQLESDAQKALLFEPNKQIQK